MAQAPDWLDEKRIDIQLRMLHLQSLAEQLDPVEDLTFWQIRALLMGAIYSLWRAMFLLPAENDEFDTTDEAQPAKKNAFDDFMSGIGDDVDAADAGYHITNAAARLMVLGQIKGAEAVLSPKTRAKCAQLSPELVMAVDEGGADLQLMWSTALHVFDHALADIQAVARDRPSTSAP